MKSTLQIYIKYLYTVRKMVKYIQSYNNTRIYMYVGGLQKLKEWGSRWSPVCYRTANSSSGRQIIVYIFAIYISEATGYGYIQICEKCTQDYCGCVCAFCNYEKL